MINIFHKINEILAEICGWLLMIIATLLITDFFTRSLGKPVQGLTQIAVFVTVAVIYLGIPRCEEYQEHVNVEVFLNILPPKVVDVLNLIIYVLELFVMGLFLQEMVNNLIMSYTTKEAVCGTIILLVWPTKLAMLIGLMFYSIQIFINLIKHIVKFKNKIC